MQKITTVTGDIAPEELGFTSMHEHTLHSSARLAGVMLRGMPDMMRGIRSYDGGNDVRAELARRKQEGLAVPAQSIGAVLRSMRLKRGNPAARLTQEEYYLRELKLYAEHGGQSLCDCSPLLPGETSLARIRDLSVRAQVKILAAAGYYTKAMIPRSDFSAGGAEMQRKIEQMLDEGDPRSGARCGFVKAAVGTVEHGALSPCEEAAVRAAALAAKHHAMSLHIHTAFPVRAPMILKLADLLVRELRMDPQKIIFCHMDSYNIGSSNPAAAICAAGYDLTLPRELCRRGFNIGLDTWSIPAGTAPAAVFARDAREGMLLELIAEGFAPQITLGHDMMSVGSGAQNGGSGYLLWPDTLAALQRDGLLTAQDSRLLTTGNPARILAHEV